MRILQISKKGKKEKGKKEAFNEMKKTQIT